MIIQWKWLFQTLFKGYAGVTIFFFIFVNDKNNKVLINHEKIHIAQQIELLFVGQWILYAFERAFNYLYYGDSTIAYYNISFEKEAYANQENLNYLTERKLFAWYKYL